jgi:SET domain-containing protein
MTKEELISNLIDIYIELRPSPIHGIGIFAIRNIPKGCRDMFSKDNSEWIPLPKDDVEQLPDYSKRMVEEYFVHDDKFYYIEKNCLKKIDLVCYLNHSDEPNIRVINNGNIFEAITDIKAGQELFINYSEVVD